MSADGWPQSADDVRPIWMTRGRAEDAGLEDCWDEDLDRYEAIKTHAEAILVHHQSRGGGQSWTFPERVHCNCGQRFPCKQREHAEAILEALTRGTQ